MRNLIYCTSIIGVLSFICILSLKFVNGLSKKTSKKEDGDDGKILKLVHVVSSI